MGFYGFVYGFLYFYELSFVALSPFCLVLFFVFFFFFLFLFLCLYLGCVGLVWIFLSGSLFIGKAGTWELQCCWIFFFFFWELYMRFRELGWFICVKELLDFFYVFRVQCWINWKCKLSVWWNDFVSYVWFID